MREVGTLISSFVADYYRDHSNRHQVKDYA